MFRFTAAVLMIASATAHGAAPVSRPDPDAHLKALEGTWEVVTYEVKGKKASGAGYADLKNIIISAGKTNLLEREETDLPIKIDPSKTPHAIDVYLIDAMKAKAHVKGIYALDGDNLQICLPLSMEAERPTKFSSENFHRLYILRRNKGSSRTDRGAGRASSCHASSPLVDLGPPARGSWCGDRRGGQRRHVGVRARRLRRRDTLQELTLLDGAVVRGGVRPWTNHSFSLEKCLIGLA